MKSEVEIIGTALFGKSWMSQVAENLIGTDGNPLTRQAIQNWHRSDRLPQWAKSELKKVAQKRLSEIQAINDTFNNHDSVVNQVVDNFIHWNGSKLNAQSSIYCQLRFGADKYNNEVCEAEISLEPKTGEGWQKHQFDEKYFQRDLLNIRKILREKLDPIFAIPVEN